MTCLIYFRIYSTQRKVQMKLQNDSYWYFLCAICVKSAYLDCNEKDLQYSVTINMFEVMHVCHWMLIQILWCDESLAAISKQEKCSDMILKYTKNLCVEEHFLHHIDNYITIELVRGTDKSDSKTRVYTRYMCFL